MYGAGHGGAEAMILLGLTSINNLVNTALINSGSLPDVLSGLDETTLESVLGGVSQLWTAPAYIFLWPVSSAPSPFACTSRCRCWSGARSGTGKTAGTGAAFGRALCGGFCRRHHAQLLHPP